MTALDRSLLLPPHETLLHVTRNAHKVVVKDLSQISLSLRQLALSLHPSSPPPSQPHSPHLHNETSGTRKRALSSSPSSPYLFSARAAPASPFSSLSSSPLSSSPFASSLLSPPPPFSLASSSSIAASSASTLPLTSSPSLWTSSLSPSFPSSGAPSPLSLLHDSTFSSSSNGGHLEAISNGGGNSDLSAVKVVQALKQQVIHLKRKIEEADRLTCRHAKAYAIRLEFLAQLEIQEQKERHQLGIHASPATLNPSHAVGTTVKMESAGQQATISSNTSVNMRHLANRENLACDDEVEMKDAVQHFSSNATDIDIANLTPQTSVSSFNRTSTLHDYSDTKVNDSQNSVEQGLASLLTSATIVSSFSTCNGYSAVENPISSPLRTTSRTLSPLRPRASSTFDLSSIRSLTPPPTPINRLLRLCVDHLLRCGYYASAKQLIAACPHLHCLLDIDLFVSLKHVTESLRRGDISRALQWCGEHRSRLNRLGSSFEFELRVHDFFTLVEHAQDDAAIEYARKYLAPLTLLPATRSGETEHPTANGEVDGTQRQSVEDAVATYRTQRLQQAMAAMLYYKMHRQSPNSVPSSSLAYRRYSAFWSPHRWQILEHEFRLIHLRVHGLPLHSSLTLMLYSGLVALKTARCRFENVFALSAQHLSQSSTMKADNDDQEHGSVPPAQAFLRLSPLVRTSIGIDASIFTGLGNTSNSDVQSDLCSSIWSEMPRINGPITSSENKALSQVLSSSNATVGGDQNGYLLASLPVHHSTSCPVCTSSELWKLSQLLPSTSHRNHSVLVCPFQHTTMSDTDPPLVLPSGSVASTRALTKRATANNGFVTCHITKQTYRFEELRPAFVI